MRAVRSVGYKIVPGERGERERERENKIGKKRKK